MDLNNRKMTNHPPSPELEEHSTLWSGISISKCEILFVLFILSSTTKIVSEHRPTNVCLAGIATGAS